MLQRQYILGPDWGQFSLAQDSFYTLIVLYSKARTILVYGKNLMNYSIWCKRWKNITTCRQTKLFFPEINDRLSKNLRKN